MPLTLPGDRAAHATQTMGQSDASDPAIGLSASGVRAGIAAEPRFFLLRDALRYFGIH